MNGELIRYWVRGTDDQTYGPVDIATLETWAHQSKIIAETLLCRENDPNKQWIRASGLVELHFAASPPPAYAAPVQAPVMYWSDGRLTVEKGATVGHGDCVLCGTQGATAWKRNFTWIPPWTGLLILIAIPIYIIVALILQKKAAVHLVTCRSCQRKWRGASIAIGLEGVLGLFAFPTILGLLGSETGLYNGGIGVLLGLAIWFFGLIYLVAVFKPNRQVSVKKIDEQHVTLKFPKWAVTKEVLDRGPR